MVSSKSFKKGSKAKGEPKIIKNKSGGPSSMLLGASLKHGDVRSSPSQVGRPSNLQKRTVETNRSIADGSQRTILEAKNFHKL